MDGRYIGPMDTAAIDRDLDTLSRNAAAWARTSLDDKIHLLERLVVRADRMAADWVSAAAAAKGLPEGSPLVGEEWMSGPYALIYGATAVAETLERLATGRDLLEGFPIRVGPDGRVSVQVYPKDLIERLLLSGLTAEVRMMEGVDTSNLRDTMATFYRQEHPQGTVTLVLGAGNIASIAPLDLVTMLINRGSVVMLKMNPVNDYLGPIFEDIFAPFVDAGYVRFAYGGSDVGEYLVRHRAVDAVHMTGSARTHDAIVYGTGDDGAARKAADRPIFDKPLTSELGGVGPTIVVPGRWSDADLRFHAEHLVTQKLHNSGFNCIANQVIVLPEGWPGSERLVDEIERVVRGLEPRPAYYPGADERVRRFAEAHPSARALTDAATPVTLIENVDPGSDALCFSDEAFGPVLATTTLPAPDVGTYLAAAVEFANDRLSGTLGANVLVHPRTLRAEAPSVERAILDLRYGTVALNTWTGVGFLLPRATWGAFPGHRRNDIQSGVGVVHNALMFERPERTILRGPFAPAPRTFLTGEFHVAPKPPFFVTNRQAAVVGERLTRHAANPSWLRFGGIIGAALRG